MNLSSANLPRFRTYADLQAHYDTVKPLRSGKERGNRPLGNRRYKYCQIHKHDETGAFTLELYGQSVITWFPNDIVHFSLCGWDTVATRQFMYAITPYPVTHERGTTYLWIGDNAYPFHNSQCTLEVNMKTNTVLNPTQEHVHVLDRKKFKEVKSRYGDFREYVASMGRVLTAIREEELTGLNNEGKMEKILLSSQSKYHGYHKARASRVQYMIDVYRAQESQNFEKYYALFLQLGASCLYYHYHLKAYVREWSDHEIEIATPMLKFFDELVKYCHKEEVFITKEVPIGKKVSNENRKYFI